MRLDGCSCLHRKARRQRIQVGIGVDLRTINVEFFAPDELLLLALLHNGLEEAAKDLNPIAVANFGQTRMVRKRFVQIIPQVPSDAEPIGRMPYQLTFGATALEEHNELQFEEDDRINRWPAAVLRHRTDQVADKRQIELGLKMP